MKILTKEWAVQYDQVRVIHWLKEFDATQYNFEEIKKLSINDFYDSIIQDIELNKLALGSNLAEELYTAQVDRNRKLITSLPKKVYSKIKDVKSVILGYANKEDKELLSSYANELMKILSEQAEKANKATKIAQESLSEEFDVDDFIGELVYEDYIKGNDYYISIGDCEICVENYQIIEREDFVINEWEEHNPLSLWTSLHSAELHYISNELYELHLLLIDGDKYENIKYWNFTLRGTNVKIVKD